MPADRSKPAINITLWILQALLAVVFLFAAYSKITRDSMQVEGFAAFGFSPWFLVVVGGAELAGAIGLLIPRLTGLAATCLTALMIGAFIAQLTIMEAFAPPLGVGLLLGVVAWGRRYTVKALPQLWQHRS